MHFRDSKRKVDYVLAYHYRKRTAHHAGGSPGALHRRASLAIISNGETAKSHPEQQQEEAHSQDAPNPDALVIDMGPLDVLEEAKREQREEFERNLVAAGLEIEKDVEVSSQFFQCKLHSVSTCELLVLRVRWNPCPISYL